MGWGGETICKKVNVEGGGGRKGRGGEEEVKGEKRRRTEERSRGGGRGEPNVSGNLFQSGGGS